ncbi:MAG: hypothetical protein KCHDKBKB_01743 [Elusimicrobia bacterium]|nr:hypothetical protein [Elusimicrobiota bacterium]
MMAGLFAIGAGLLMGQIVWVGFDVVIERRARQQFFIAIDPVRALKSRRQFFFSRKTHRDQRREQFPDFLDLFSVGLSAGLTLEQAWSLGVEKCVPGILKEDLSVLKKVIDWGYPRQRAFREVAERLDDETLALTLVLIEQAMNHGQKLGEVLRHQARSHRQQRWAQMERRAQTVGLRLLFPMFVFILPAVLIILLAPIFLTLAQGKLFY